MTSVSRRTAAFARFLCLGCVAVSAVADAAGPRWTKTAEGVETATVGKLTVLRVDPKKTNLTLLSAAGAGEPPDGLTWAKSSGLLAVMNAGMFDAAGRTVGYAKSGGAEVNEAWRRDYRAVLVADPLDPSLPPVQLLDTECDDVQALLPKYRVALQSIRMVSCKGRNTWRANLKQWSAVIAAVDAEGRVLFIHSRAPYTMHALIDEVLKQPLGVTRALYLEGGPEATLAVRQRSGEYLLRVGSYETGFNEDDLNDRPWALPNVLAVTAK